METRLCYQVLELQPGVSRAELRQAYRDLVQVWHPDRFPHNPRLRVKAEAKLIQINRAYRTLKHLHEQGQAVQTEKPQPPPPPPPPPSPRSAASRSPASRSAASRSETNRSETAQSKTAQSKTAQSKTVQSKTAQSKTSRPETHRPGTNRPGTNPSGSHPFFSSSPSPPPYPRRRKRRWLHWLATALGTSLGLVLLFCAPFLTAYLMAQQPGLFLLPAIAFLSVYGYRALGVRS